MSDRVQRIASALKRPVQVVERDLRLIAGMRRNLAGVIDQFFVLGGGWLHNPLEPWAVGFVDRWNGAHEFGCEVLARYHMKTLLGGKISPALWLIFGISPYHVVMSHSESNYKGNLSAVWNILTSPQFEKLQWFLPYMHGPEAPVRSDNLVRMPGSGSLIEFRSLMGESRGANYAEAGGRPSDITLDDVIPTTAYSSETIRETIIDRYLSMVVPMRKQGGRVRIIGTVAHRDDLIGLILSGRLAGYVVTPPEHRVAYNEHTHEVTFKGRWTYEQIMRLKVEQYDSVGRGFMWRKEMLNDPAEADTHPFHDATLERYKPGNILPYTMHRVVAVDHAHGLMGDYFAAVELGIDYHGNVFVLKLERSNTWTTSQRVASVIAILRRRMPHVLVVEDTTESRTFIEVLEQAIRDEGLHVNIERPTASSRGNKNMHILGRIQPLVNDGALIVPEGDTVIEHELRIFDLTSKHNIDDVIDAIASGVRYLVKPDKNTHRGKVKTGDALSDEILDEIYGTDAPQYVGGRW